MKKKIIVCILWVLIFVSSVFCLSGCALLDKIHAWDNGVITKEATCGVKGLKTFSCSRCKKTKTEEIPATGEHTYDEGVIIEQATCVEVGVVQYTCTVCQHVKEGNAPLAEEHVLENVKVLVEPTCTEEGVGLYTCTLCGEEVEQAIATLPSAYTITIEGYGECLVPESGKYVLEDAVKIGYDFVKWVDENGKDFESVGTVDKDVTIKPLFSLADTTTVEQLEERAAAGTDYIKITKDIVVDRTIYVLGKTVVYSEKAVTLTRDANFAGDMFVIGQDKDGNSHILTNGLTEVSFGMEDTSNAITIDGNSGKTTVDVVGSALFVVNGSIVNMYDGVSIANHTKVGNERILLYEEYIGSTKSRVGGAGAIIVSGLFTMYGGLFENNIVNTTNIGAAESEDDSYYVSSYGGAIYNCGTFTMQGGAIKNNVANRGGAVFTQMILKLQAGVVEGNYAENKGGAICNWATGYCDTIVGTETAELGTILFKNNVAKIQGGVILSYDVSPIVVLGGARFEGNKAETSVGGVIATTGPVTVYNSEFINNYAYESGGTIYQSYDSSHSYTVTLTNCVFDGNMAGRGGAILISAAKEATNVTSLAINGCTFRNNGAQYRLVNVTDKDTGVTTQQNYYGSGGAIYVTKGTRLQIENSTFKNNTAELSAGAIYVTTNTTTTVSDSVFLNNKAVRYGAAIYAGSAKSLSVLYCEFTGNGSFQDGEFTTERGGGIYATDTEVTAIQCQYVGNNASYGAALYMSGSASYTDEATSLETASLFENNNANRGGAIALYGMVSVNFAQFKGNTATQHGGAIYLGTNAVLAVSNSSFTDNLVTVASVDGDEKHLGGAIAAMNGSITANECIFSGNTLTAEAGSVIFKLYGGGVGASGQSFVRITNSQFMENNADYGGAISALGFGGNTFETVNITLNKNTSANCGGGIYVNAAKAVVENIEATANESRNGGVIYASDCVSLAITGESVFENNIASGSGGAVYFTTGTLSVTGATFKGNSGVEGGAIRITASETNTAVVQITNITFESNSSTSGGGAVYVTDGDVVIANSEFNGNGAGTNGGAISFMRADVEITESTFDGNTASLDGGAIYTTQSNNGVQTKTVSCIFTHNSATERGGGVYATGTGKHVDESSTINANSSKNGGAVHVYGEVALVESIIENNTASNGGAVYVSKGTLTLANASFKNNTANENGGALYLLAGVTVTDENSAYTENKAENGGAVYISATTQDQTVGGEYVTIGVSFTENSATKNGGAICAYNDAKVVLTDVSLIGNTANGSGGALWTYTRSLTQIKGIVAKGNAANGSGGVMYTRGDLAVLSEQNVTNVFGGTEANETNVSGEEGGAIRVLATESIVSVIQINGTSFINNTSTNGGGAMYVTDGDVVIANSEFNGNGAGTNGGAISFMRADVEITECTFDGNKAKSGNGGAIYTTQSNTSLKQNGTKTVSCVFENNNASGNGGAVYVTGTGKHVDENSTFDGNSAVNGGATYNPTNGTLTFAGSIVKNNTATLGGAIYSASTTTITNANFTENTSKNGGGAIYASGGTVTVVGGNMAGNAVTSTATYTDMGGAIGVDKSTTVTVSDVVFTGNNGGASGGAIGLYGASAVAVVENCSFTANMASNGGTFYVGGAGKLTVTGITVKESTASANGAVIYTTSGSASTVTVNSITLYNNCIDKNTKTSYGFIFLNNAKNVLNIHKGNFVLKNAQTGEIIAVSDWSKLIWNKVNATVNELTA